MALDAAIHTQLVVLNAGAPIRLAIVNADGRI